MVQGANAYLKFRPRVDISLISAAIFSFFGATGDEPIMQFRYPEDTDLIDGIIYIGFTQEQTMTLYEASGGLVEMEVQINIGDQTAVKPCAHRIRIRRSRETEIIEGNQPDYKLPDQVIDLETGTVVLLRGEKGEPGKKGEPGDTPYIGENGNWWVGDTDTGYAPSGEGGSAYRIGDGLKLDAQTNTLSVDTATEVEADNTRPITAAAVYETVGNIEVLLGTI